MNVPYPGFSEPVGFAVSVASSSSPPVVLYFVFKRKDWL
jgi:Mg2+ and Co2+ transporters